MLASNGMNNGIFYVQKSIVILIDLGEERKKPRKKRKWKQGIAYFMLQCYQRITMLHEMQQLLRPTSYKCGSPATTPKGTIRTRRRAEWEENREYSLQTYVVD